MPLGRTLGTAGGAAIGTAIMPGVGTILGGALGGVVGGLFDGSDSKQAPQITDVGYGGELGRSGLAFGQSEANRVARDTSQRAGYDMNQGTAALQRGQQLGGQAQLAAFQGQQGAADQQARSNAFQGQAIGAANQYGGMSAEERAQTQGALARLQGFYTQGPGPSAAEAQMQAGNDANMAQQIALARSGRGVGANAAAMRQAQFQNAASGQQLNQQLGVLRANEAANWRQQQLAAMGMEQNTLAGMRGQDINAQGQAYGFAGQMGQQGLGYGNLGLGYMNAGNQAQLGFENMGNQTNLGFNQLGNQAYEFGETMRNKIYNDTTSWNLQSQMANANLAQGGQALAQKQDAADNALLGSALASAGGMMGGGGGGGGGTGTLSDYSVGPNGYVQSDRRSKESVRRYLSSPIEAKKDIRPEDSETALRAYWRPVVDATTEEPRQALSMSSPPIVPGRADTDLRPAQGFSYKYKDPTAPGADEGTHYGPMADHLELTPAGRSTVKVGPDGKKMVDTGRLALVNTAAVSELQNRVDKLESMLDDSYGRETRDTGPRFVMSDSREKQAAFESGAEHEARIRDLESILGRRYGESSAGPSVPSSMIGWNQAQPQGIEAMQTSRYALPTQETADAAAMRQQILAGR